MEVVQFFIVRGSSNVLSHNPSARCIAIEITNNLGCGECWESSSYFDNNYNE